MCAKSTGHMGELSNVCPNLILSLPTASFPSQVKGWKSHGEITEGSMEEGGLAWA